MPDPTTADQATRLRGITDWMRTGAYYIDQAEQERDIAACLAGADALEENQQLHKHLGEVERAAEALLEAAEGVPQNVSWGAFQTKAAALADALQGALDLARQARPAHQPTPDKDQP